MPDHSFATFAVDQLRRALPVRTRQMFGCTGIYSGELFFAIATDDALYLKVDDSNRADYESLGMTPFRPYDDERTLSYWRVPADVLEDSDRLGAWAERSLEVARRAR